jgi:hypothetical protein
LDFSDLIIFSISLGVEYFSFMFEQGSLKFVWKLCMGLGLTTITIAIMQPLHDNEPTDWK